MLYAVIPLGDNDQLPAFLEQEAEKLYDETAPQVYFLASNKTASALSDALQLGHEGGEGIVLRVTANAGYTYKTLWDWLEMGES